MKAKQRWTVQSFVSCFFWNAILVGVLFFMGTETLQSAHKFIDILMPPGGSPLPTEDMQNALMNLKTFVDGITHYVAPVVLGTGALMTLLLWLSLLFQGRGLVRRAQTEVPAPTPKAAPGLKAKDSATKVPPASVFPAVEEPPAPQAAIQILSLLQREGRFIDFLQEDLSQYDDAQIGAAVRGIHQGCKAALSGHLELKPIFDKDEGSEVTVPPHFDPNTVRLTGNVSGDPPFTGALKHRGWQATRVTLPITAKKDKDQWIIMPAEVEIE